MARQFERYRFRDQVTRLDEATFNPIWADLDLRIAKLEALQVEWESAVGLVSDQGLARVAATMSGPLATLSAEVADLRAQIDAAQQEGMLLDGAGTVSDSNLGMRTVDETAAPASDTGTLTELLSGVVNRLKAITGAANWRANPATSLAALASAFAASTSHIANRSNPHQVTPAQVGAAPVGGSAAQVYAVANATADTHAVNLQTGDGRYLRRSGGTLTGALTANAAVNLAAGATLGAALAAGNQPIGGVKTLGFYGEYDNGNSGSSKTITLANGAMQKLTLTQDEADITIHTTGAPIGEYQLRLVNTSSFIDRADFVGMSGRWIGQSSGNITVRTGSGSETWVTLWWTGAVLVGSFGRVGAS